MEIPPQEAPPGPGADGETEEAPAEARSPSPASPPADGRLKAAAKRVTFPSDEDIVSGAVEPKDPWRHAQNVTVDEVIGAYKQACQKLNCRQIPKLLRQLQEFTDLGHRIDCLDLKGEKLDYKTCEALEEIFKRLQFKVVDLEQTNLDEDGASALFDMIEYYESATHLNISFNKHIGTRGWQAAAHMMRKTSCLQYLDARNTPLLDHSAPFVARALRIRSSLAVLHLENASLSGRPLMLLATALKMNMTLRELYLADNKLNGLQDSAQLGNLLKFNCSLQILDLRNNHVLDSGLAYICEGLKEQRKGLATLVLWNNQLTHTGMAFLGMTLPHTHSLETLNLGHNPIGNEGVRNLKNGLIGNRSVLRLGLASTKLTCEGAVAVAEFIAESPRLLRLDLRENEIKTGGLMALSLALKVNHSLLRLDLDREPKKEAVKSFIETQKALLAEIQNGCKRNFVLAREREEKEQRLQLSASMPEITVTEPQPGDEPEPEPGPGEEPTAQAQENGATAPGPGPAQSDLNVNSSPEVMLVESDLSDDGEASFVSEEEEDDEEAKATSRRSRPRRSSIGLRVALQFPTRKLAKKADKNTSSEPLFSGSRLQDNKRAILGRKTSCKQRKEREDSASESEDDSRDEGQDCSDALLKRTMNIKENKAMLAQLLAELNSMPDFFPVRTPTSASKKKTSRRAFSEGQITRRTNPARSARPPDKFALENFTVSATKFAEEFYSFRRRKTMSGGKCQGYRRRHRVSSFRPVEDITEEDLENVAITVRDKIYDKVLGNTCHQCRQKTIDTKTVCRNQSCGGVRGQFCGPCLRNRYGEDVRSALLDPDWICPPCRGICNCSYCRRRDGRCATGILIHLAKFYGYNNVKEYLESLQKQLVKDN